MLLNSEGNFCPIVYVIKISLNIKKYFKSKNPGELVDAKYFQKDNIISDVAAANLCTTQR